MARWLKWKGDVRKEKDAKDRDRSGMVSFEKRGREGGNMRLTRKEADAQSPQHRSSSHMCKTMIGTSPSYSPQPNV